MKSEFLSRSFGWIEYFPKYQSDSLFYLRLLHIQHLSQSQKLMNRNHKRDHHC